MKYICHGCGKIYDDEIGMPGKCCDKTIRHIYQEEFNLNEERKKLLEKIELPDWFYDAILEQDKEFIKKLKEEFARTGMDSEEWCVIRDIINKFAGEN